MLNFGRINSLRKSTLPFSIILSAFVMSTAAAVPPYNNLGKPVIIEPTEKHTATVIFMHGLGDTGSGWADVADMWSDAFPYIRFYLPTAPRQPVSINMGMKMPSWYDIKTLSSREGDDFQGVEEARSTVVKFIEDEEKERGIPSNRIIVGGFSQGAAVSLYSAYTQDKKLAGVIAFSGYLLKRDHWARSITKPNKNTPLFMCHGTADSVVKYSWGEDSFKFIQSNGVASAKETQFLSIPGMEHSASQDEITKAAEFIRKVLPPVAAI